ncbi:T9SS type A sorting domain-containing protein [Fulvivirga maritima]|uniref:T9SS-dependent choice-of-anchor J family protein n=1 Tax=Fulvivirga maritima TaxID=2904247 RepID=UPI001F32913E|nr:choice-of-anchor J domain-containing protein [Fulvivirga maritima]UII27182.1 T9SS type A sorting domain-containing protein [Fulvivirga maritima]
MRKFYLSIHQILLTSFFAFLLFISGTSYSQNTTFFEGFDNTEMGELPSGWTFYQNGGTDPQAHWGVTTYGFFGQKVAFAGIEAAMPGMIDEDWLITPQITPAEGDFLIFDAAQTYTGIDYGTKYHVLISTASNDHTDFLDTLATFDENTFPKYMETRYFDLADYANQPIYIAFIHETASNDPNQTDDWYLDNVYVRPIQEAGFASAEIYWQGDIPIRISESSFTPFLGFRVRISGDEGVPNLSSLKLTTNGTGSDLKIDKATIYSTGDVSFISYWDGNVDAEVFGEIENPSDTFEITGDQDLLIGDNFFWLAYTVDNEQQPEYPYERVDGSLEGVTIDGVENTGAKDSLVVSPYIVPDVIPNDNRADAIEINAASGSYGSFNMGATPEVEVETLAYCSDGGTYDNANSVWWHFVAPSEGFITVDLTGSNFNTLLVFMDENLEQLACNNDIETGINVQSRIENFPVKTGQEVYIRVTGTGTAGDPNGESGVVSLDFTYRGLVSGVDDDLDNQAISLPYPNPTSGITSFDVKIDKNDEVTAEVLDVFGRNFNTIYKGRVSAGETQTINFDTSLYPSGTYLIQLRGSEKIYGTQRLIVTH